jgi:hypothetical protein
MLVIIKRCLNTRQIKVVRRSKLINKDRLKFGGWTEDEEVGQHGTATMRSIIWHCRRRSFVLAACAPAPGTSINLAQEQVTQN